ncbi:MAG: hypothetical protein JWP35_1625 [Caulobacter sp.]|nr:hypothetical protein [Caulobacter sp.]
MIFKRAAARLRAQDWMAIAIELAIVIVGVFIGTWVANWNQQQTEKAETRRMVVQLGPTLKQMTDYFVHARRYYAVTRSYTDVAIAGWRGDPKVSDRDFVIAAYQASQINTLGTNSTTLSTVLGADRLHSIDDPNLRSNLTYLMTSDYSLIDDPAVDTPYRHNVRRVIPVEIQDAIRAQCGDRPVNNTPYILTLPATCDLKLSAGEAAAGAAALRRHPELLEDLQFHVAAVAAFLENITPFETAAQQVERRIDRR